MPGSGLHYFPLSGAFLLLLAAGLTVLLLLVLLHVLRYAYSRIGIAPQYFFSILVLTLVGSYVNLPLVEFPEARVLSPQLVTVYGVPYVVPLVRDYPGTVLAINVGGGLIPVLLSMYLIVKNRIYRQAAWGVLIVAADAAAGDGRGGVLMTAIAGIAGASILAVSHGVAWLMDRRAERVVGR